MPDIYTKEFDRWNEKKKKTDSKQDDTRLYVHEREVWWCSVGVNIGSEIDGKNENFERPVLIMKVIGNGFFGIPLTSKQKGHQYEVSVVHDKGTSYANVSQLRFLSRKRMLRKIGAVPDEDFLRVRDRLRDMFR